MNRIDIVATDIGFKVIGERDFPEGVILREILHKIYLGPHISWEEDPSMGDTARYRLECHLEESGNKQSPVVIKCLHTSEDKFPCSITIE